MVVEILALLVDCKSRPLESCMLMFIDVISIDYDSLISLSLSVSFSLQFSFQRGALSKMRCCASGTDSYCICIFVG